MEKKSLKVSALEQSAPREPGFPARKALMASIGLLGALAVVGLIYEVTHYV